MVTLGFSIATAPRSVPRGAAPAPTRSDRLVAARKPSVAWRLPVRDIVQAELVRLLPAEGGGLLAPAGQAHSGQSNWLQPTGAGSPWLIHTRRSLAYRRRLKVPCPILGMVTKMVTNIPAPAVINRH